jgi:hypothetical protein
MERGERERERGESEWEGEREREKERERERRERGRERERKRERESILRREKRTVSIFVQTVQAECHPCQTDTLPKFWLRNISN